MSWTDPRTWVLGELVTAPLMNTHLRDNLLELRGGGLALASQTAGDLITAASATQFGRVAAANAGLFLVSQGAGLPPAYSSAVAPGTVIEPSLTFTGDPNTGIWQASADHIDFATGGANRLDIANTAITIANGVQLVASATGTALLPSYTFAGDTNTGLSVSAPDQIAISTGGVSRIAIGNTSTVFGVNTQALLPTTGTASAPSLAFNSDENTGVYRVTTDSMGIAAGGLLVAGFENFSGEPTFTTHGPAAFNNRVQLAGIISVAVGVGPVNNWTPLGIAGARIIRLTGSVGGSTITGLTAQPSGTIVTIINVGNPDITFSNESASSTAGNRFALPFGDALIITDNQITLWYDGLSSRWRFL